MYLFQFLSEDVFSIILEYLSIEERIQLRPMFPMFESCFIKINNALKNSKAIGIDTLSGMEDFRWNVFNYSIKKLYFRYKLYEHFDCYCSEHILRYRFSSNQSLFRNVSF